MKIIFQPYGFLILLFLLFNAVCLVIGYSEANVNYYYGGSCERKTYGQYLVPFYKVGCWLGKYRD